MDLEEFALDLDAWENGRTVPISGGAYLRIRGATSEIAGAARERLWKPHGGWVHIPDDALVRLTAAWIVEGLLSEFAGFTMEGAAIEVDLSKPDDQKRLAEILGLPKFRQLRDVIIAFASDDANFRPVLGNLAEVDHAR